MVSELKDDDYELLKEYFHSKNHRTIEIHRKTPIIVLEILKVQKGKKTEPLFRSVSVALIIVLVGYLVGTLSSESFKSLILWDFPYGLLISFVLFLIILLLVIFLVRFITNIMSQLEDDYIVYEYMIILKRSYLDKSTQSKTLEAAIELRNYLKNNRHKKTILEKFKESIRGILKS